MENRKLTKDEWKEYLTSPERNADLAHCRMWMTINSLVRAENDLWVAEDAYGYCDPEKEKLVRSLKTLLTSIREELNTIAES